MFGSPPRAWGRLLRDHPARPGIRFTPTCVGTASPGSSSSSWDSVHPHVRGDGFSGIIQLVLGFGSPPRAWGRLLRDHPARPGIRFTPTCVGTASPGSSSSSWDSVHPHVRGDGFSGIIQLVLGFGSPPRAWGRLLRDHPARPGIRFTPTCVGTASPGSSSSSWDSVHPHVRGDGFSGIIQLVLGFGSPPRAWGRLLRDHPARPGIRFTPTCVGTASPGSSSSSWDSVHPHVRGDGFSGIIQLVLGFGSPPRAWGRLLRDHPARPGIRFTPTCVGTASPGSSSSSWDSVHPHVRGDGFSGIIQLVLGFGSPPRAWDGFSGIIQLVLGFGSPPRAWGRLLRDHPARPGIRFTPTCVGTASPGSSSSSWDSVHPHVRGDGFSGIIQLVLGFGFTPHVRGDGFSGIIQLVLGFGSPPRAWGRLLRDHPARPGIRFTPTCVGTASPGSSSSSWDSVHPHVRGDGFSGIIQLVLGFGSPPRAWGRLLRDHPARPGIRFTPTCVGTASPGSSSSSWDSVHPHVRGDGGSLFSAAGLSDGSPPRAWGRRKPVQRSGVERRFTPTCVGTAEACSAQRG